MHNETYQLENEQLLAMIEMIRSEDCEDLEIVIDYLSRQNFNAFPIRILKRVCRNLNSVSAYGVAVRKLPLDSRNEFRKHSANATRTWQALRSKQVAEWKKENQLEMK